MRISSGIGASRNHTTEMQFVYSCFFFIETWSQCSGACYIRHLSWRTQRVGSSLAPVSCSTWKDSVCCLTWGAKWFWHWTLLNDVFMQVQLILPQRKLLCHHSQQTLLTKYREREILCLRPLMRPSRALQSQILQNLIHYKINQLVLFRDSRKLLSSMGKSWFQCTLWLPLYGLDPFTMRPWSKSIVCCSVQYRGWIEIY